MVGVDDGTDVLVGVDVGPWVSVGKGEFVIVGVAVDGAATSDALALVDSALLAKTEAVLVNVVDDVGEALAVTVMLAD